MGYTIRDFASIASQMVAALASMATEITDYTEGAAARSLLETVAMELQRFDTATYQGLREAIETGTYKNFDFFRQPATYSTGNLLFTRENTVAVETIPLGTHVRVPGSTDRTYQTLAVGTMAIGVASVSVPVRCVTAGTAGNTPQNTVVEQVEVLSVSVTVTNPLPFLTGVDQETDLERRARFRTFIAGLGKGTREAIRFAAMSTMLTDANGNALERVTSAQIIEPFMLSEDGRLGLVQVYVDNGTGTSSADLLTKVGQIIRGFVDGAGAVQKGYIAAGIDLDVFGVAAQPLDVLCTVTVAPGFVPADVAAEVETALQNYLASLQVFDVAILAKMIEVAMETDGVTDIVFASPTSNVDPGAERRVTPGTVTVLTA